MVFNGMIHQDPSSVSFPMFPEIRDHKEGGRLIEETKQSLDGFRSTPPCPVGFRDREGTQGWVKKVEVFKYF